MDYALRQKLPLELVEKIMKEVHRKNFRDCLNSIKYCVVKIYAPKDGGYCFITSNNPNYYVALLEEDLTFQIINRELKRKCRRLEDITMRRVRQKERS